MTDEYADFGAADDELDSDFGGLDDDFGDERGTLTLAELEMQRRAEALADFCDGLDDGRRGRRYAFRARAVARDALELLEQLAAERSARRAMQEERDRWRAAHREAWPR